MEEIGKAGEQEEEMKKRIEKEKFEFEQEMRRKEQVWIIQGFSQQGPKNPKNEVVKMRANPDKVKTIKT